LKTSVTYPVDGVSHFDLLRDNLRMAGLHLRLAAGFVLRLPLLLARRVAAPFAARSDANAADHQAARQPHWASLRRSRSVGRPVVPVRRVPVRGAVGFIRSCCGRSPFISRCRVELRGARRSSIWNASACSAPDASVAKRWCHVVRHIERFADALLDKTLAWTGALDVGATRMNVDPRFDAAVEAGEGGILVVAHCGNLEVLRALALRLPKVRLKILVHTRPRTNRFNRLLTKLKPAERNQPHAK